MKYRIGLFLTLLMSLAHAAGDSATPPTDPGFKRPWADLPKPSAELVAEVDRLVRLLGDDDWRTRRDAQQRLDDLPVTAAIPLSGHYRRNNDAEVAWRVEHYAEQLFRQRLLGHYIEQLLPGFMGVAHIPATVGQWQGIAVTQVVPDSGAARAGLRVNDMIIAVDGKMLEPADPAGSFAATVQNRPPGRTVKVTLVRNGEPMELDVTLGQMPQAYHHPRHQHMQKRIDHLYDLWWEQAFLKGRLDLPAEVLYGALGEAMESPQEKSPDSVQIFEEQEIEVKIMPIPVPRE